MTREGDENHNETKKFETLCINSLGNNTSSTYKNLEKNTKDDCIITMLQRKYSMPFITRKIQRKMVSQL